MHYSAIIVALSAVASAIDIRLYSSNSNCGGASANCVNANPRICCGISGDRVSSIAFAAVPSSWRINMSVWSKGGCSAQEDNRPSNGGSTYCFSDSALTGGSYNFISKKRGLIPPVPERSVSDDASGTCEGTVEPDLFVLEDGTEYALPDMPKTLVETLYNLGFNGATADDIPAEIQAFTISAK
jgi:hypothetical protein